MDELRGGDPGHVIFSPGLNPSSARWRRLSARQARSKNSTTGLGSVSPWGWWSAPGFTTRSTGPPIALYLS